MTKTITPAFTLLLLLTLTLPLLASKPLTVNASSSSEASQVKEFTIVAGRTGFNGTSDTLEIQVNQGDRVRINFLYGDGDLAQDNPHEITIEGYNIVTDTLSKRHPLAIVEFTAGQVGEFRFYCSIPCIGMGNLQKGLLAVSPPKGGPYHTVSINIVHLELHPPNPNYPQLYNLHVIARLMDEEGKPVVGVIVDLYVSTSFGFMKVGSNVTEADGTVGLMYPSDFPRAMQVTPYFKGSGAYQASNVTQTFTPDVSITEKDTAPYIRGQSALIDLRLIGVEPRVGATLVAILVLVVGSVWLTYAYVLRRIFRIRRYNLKRTGGGD